MSNIRNFIIALIIGIVLFGALALILLKLFFPAPTQDSSDIPKDHEIQTGIIDESDDINSDNQFEEQVEIDKTKKYAGNSFCIAFGTVDDETGRLISLVLAKADEENERFIFAPFSTKVNLSYSATGPLGEKYDMKYNIGDLYSAYGGEYIKNKISALSGIKVDYYFFFSKSGITKAVDSIGGITFTVPYDIVEKTISETGEELSNVIVSQGTKELNGEMAALVLTDQNHIGGEKAIMKTHQGFLQCIFNKFLVPSNQSTATDTLSKIINCAITDYNLSDFTSNLDLIFAYSKLKVENVAFPENLSEISGASYNTLLETYKKYK